MTVVRAERIAKTYPGVPPVQALRDVSFSVRAGEYVAIVGVSGSGKSTLLNLLGLLDRPSAGQLRIAGRDIARLSERQRTSLRARLVGFVFQQFHLLPDRTAADNVALALSCQRVARSARPQRVSRALESVGLAHRMNATPRHLSGGEQQRVAIARALVTGPALLLADEPTGNLDTTTGAKILDVIGGLHEQGQTVVVVTHDKGVAARADRVLSMVDGRLLDTSRLSA